MTKQNRYGYDSRALGTINGNGYMLEIGTPAIASSAVLAEKEVKSTSELTFIFIHTAALTLAPRSAREGERRMSAG